MKPICTGIPPNHGGKENLEFYERVRLLCACYGYQVVLPGRPLLFMGALVTVGAELPKGGLQGQRFSKKLCVYLNGESYPKGSEQ